MRRLHLFKLQDSGQEILAKGHWVQAKSLAQAFDHIGRDNRPAVHIGYALDGNESLGRENKNLARRSTLDDLAGDAQIRARACLGMRPPYGNLFSLKEGAGASKWC